MASKKELALEAQAIADALEVEITTEGLNHAELTDLVSDLKAKKRDADITSQADDEPEADDEDSNDEPEPGDEPEPEVDDEDADDEPDADADDEPVYVIAPGKAVTSLKGIRGEGDEAKAEHFPGGDETFQDLKDRGIVVLK